MNINLSNTLHIRTTQHSYIKLPQPCFYQRCHTLIQTCPFVTKRTATHNSKIRTYHMNCALTINLISKKQFMLPYSNNSNQRKTNRNGKPL